MNAGEKISHYEIIKLLGKGGMGEVYLAHDSILDRKVAVKFLADVIQNNPDARERFLHEAKSAAALDHPFICKIYETGEAKGRSFIVMEYVEGETLGQKLARGPFPLKDALQAGVEIAEALELAHGKAIVHRDLKPSNVMCTPQGHVKVMDFGLAKKIFPDGASVTSTITQSLTLEAESTPGRIVGTIDHMSPEQAKGETIDPRSDIFSLGVILYELITGKNPFDRPTPVETLSAVLKDPVPPLTLKPKSAGPVVQSILKKCLAKKAADRYMNVKALADDLREVRDKVVAGLSWKKWASIAASGAVVVIAAAAVWRFVLAPKAAPAKARDPVTVLVADFDNRTGDPTLAEGGLEQSLVFGLEEAPFINIFRRQDAREIAGNISPERKGKLTADLGRLVCTREGIQVLVGVRIEKGTSGKYDLETVVSNPNTGKDLLRFSRSAGSKSALPAALTKLAGPVIKELGGAGAEAVFRKSVETFTTGSLEAMNAYARAQELSKAGEIRRAEEEYLRAVEADPNFGRAYSGLAVLHHNRLDHAKAEEFHASAMARLDSMNDREKYRTRGIWYLLTKNYAKATEEFTSLIKAYPGDSAGLSNLALSYFYARDMAKAVEEGRYYIKAFPRNLNGQYNLSWYAIGAGDFALGLEQARKALEISPAYAKAFNSAASAEIGLGRRAEAADWYGKLASVGELGASLSSHGLADLAMMEGRWSEAEAMAREGIAADLKVKSRLELAADKYIILGEALLQQKRAGEAVRAADSALALNPKAPCAYPAALIYLEAGKTEKAVALADELGRQFEPDPRVYAKLIAGRLARKKGSLTEAAASYEEAQKILDTWLGRLALGEAYLEAGKFGEAHAELDRCFKRRGEAAAVFQNDVSSWRYVPRVYYLLGLAQEGLKSPAAAESFKKFLEIKAKSEPDPMVEAARKRLQ